MLQFQSSDKGLTIDGERFPVDKVPKLTFGFGGPTEDIFTCKTVSETAIEVNLAAGHKWSKVAGPLYLLNFTFGEHEVCMYVLHVVVICRSNIVFYVQARLKGVHDR